MKEVKFDVAEKVKKDEYNIYKQDVDEKYATKDRLSVLVRDMKWKADRKDLDKTNKDLSDLREFK